MCKNKDINNTRIKEERMKLREFLKVEKIEASDLKLFYKRIEEKYKEALESGNQEDIKNAEILKKLMEENPKGFIANGMDWDVKQRNTLRKWYCKIFGI